MDKIKRVAAAGLGLFVLFVFRRTYDVLVPLLLRERWGWNDTAAGLLLGADELVLLLAGPVFLFFSNRTPGPWGRRGPYVLGGGALACLFLPLIPLGVILESRTLFFTALGVSLIGVSGALLPAWRLTAESTGKEDGAGGRAAFGAAGLGGLAALGLSAWLTPRPGGSGLVLALAAALVMAAGLAGLWRWSGTRGPAPAQDVSGADASPAKESGSISRFAGSSGQAARSVLLRALAATLLWAMSWGGLLPVFFKYARYYWDASPLGSAGLAAAAWMAAMFLWFPAHWLAPRLGEKRLAAAGTFLLAVALGSLIFFRNASPGAAALLALAGAAWSLGAAGTLSLIRVLAGESPLGSRCWVVALLLGGAVSPLLSGAVLQFLGYKYLFLWGTLLATLSLLTLLGVESSPPETRMTAVEPESPEEDGSAA